MDKKMAYNVHVKFLMILMCGYSYYRCNAQKLDITAFEYTRKFSPYREGFHLDLGQCAAKIVEHPGTTIRRGCILQTKSGLVRTVPKIANDSRNFEVRQISDIFGCMSLCNGNAATMLGLLHDGDCFAVEIASNLTLNKKSYTRAFVEYYRQGVDILQSDWNVDKDFSNYFENEYFLRDRSYGSMEIIIVEMSFRRKQFVDRFRNSHVGSDHLSDYLEYAEREFERPSRVKVIRLSTADDKFEMHKFKKQNFQQAVNTVKRYELEILRIREDIIRNYTKPHLNYGMLPYLASTASSIRSRQSSSDHLLWEKMSEAEVLVNQRFTFYKHIKRRCNRARISVCTNLGNIKRMLRIMKKALHKRRSKWHLSTIEQKTETPKLIKNLRRCNKELNKINSLLRHWYRQQRKNNSNNINRQTRKVKRQYRNSKRMKS